MIADGYDERVKMKVSCSHAQPMPDTSDDAPLATTSPGQTLGRVSHEAQASYHQPGPDTSQDARLARVLATFHQCSDDVIADHAHDSRQFDHIFLIHFLHFCDAQRQTQKQGIESGEKPKPAQANTEANTEAKPAQANAEANPDQARLEALSPCPHAMEQHNFLVLSLMSSKRLADLVEMMRCRSESALRRHFEAWMQAYVRKILDMPDLMDSSEDEGRAPMTAVLPRG